MNLKDTLGAENQEAPGVPVGAGCKGGVGREANGQGFVQVWN